MNSHIARIQSVIEPLRQEIINHKVYSVINDIEDLKIFMQYHVYAVWDFMSLLKSLQIGLTSTSTPWFPVGNANTRYLINEIVTGEESDVDAAGIRKSHYEMYLEAMEQCGADTKPVMEFTAILKEEKSFFKAYTEADIPKEAREFVDFTFEVIDGKQSHLQSAAFTFGREDLIPAMFISIVRDLNEKFPGQLSLIKYYLDRHIEVDGDHHSHLALDMTAELCGENEEFWKEAEEIAVASLQQRIHLWDGVYNEIISVNA
ncbi:DUF3050 domain-containing protein [Pedobacter sp. MC2016-15]|uniref:DUF3050 domain-containing protein n=1 Tax=Pedobacter sp. MC2016-15 TaxID=2994473 RepID=UPI002247A949|nr:DUF3050 domain-containing protein [Pedobacter sp. MC2016-15]MCX2480099.1 DUF3050 domain-containing protein [Pedobacter sp. MC2016-15]